MATFEERVESAAPPEEVWKLIYDPEQFKRWWGCLDAGETPQTSTHPDFPLPEVVESTKGDGRITVSCVMSDIRFEWRLEDRDGNGTLIRLHMEVPDSYGLKLESQRELIGYSLKKLAALGEEQMAPSA